MSQKNIYRGFSTFEFQRNKSLSLRDVELVKLDLLNHLFTSRGTRVMMPTFGTTLPSLVFEPMDEITVEDARTEVRAVFDFDPRVRIVTFKVIPDYDNNTLIIDATLFYIELNTVDDFNLNIQFEG